MHQTSYIIKEEIIETTQGYQTIGGFWQLRKININIQHSSKNELIYLQDGEILKKEKNNDNLEINKNIEMIKYAQWEGELNNENMKCGNWQACWKGKRLGVGGYYNEQNLKTGKWVEFFNQYWEQIINYTGKQKVILEINLILLFFILNILQIFNQFKRNQIYLILIYFISRCQVILRGEYKNGKKLGVWETNYRQQHREQFQIMQFKKFYKNQFKEVYALMTKMDSNKEGHLKYLKNFGSIKLQMLKSLLSFRSWRIQRQQQDREMGHFKQIIYYTGWRKLQLERFERGQMGGARIKFLDIGDYQNGIKVGFWKTQFKRTELFDYQDIGGGSYINDKKTGRWKEIHDNFHNQCEVINAGEYFNGVKIGQWNTLYKGIRQDEFIKIGGGQYFNGKKIKQWVDLHANFQNLCQVIQTGLYEEGLKQGQWAILFRINNQENYQNIGTGYYENGLQIGKSCELHSIYFKYVSLFFNHKLSKYQIVWTGEYTKGYKNGLWDIIWKNKSNDNQEKIIGGGTYLNGLKIGQWADLVEKFSSQSWQETVIVGEYVNGEKLGDFTIQQII